MFRKMLERAESGKMVGLLVQDIDSKALKLQGDLHTDCELKVVEGATERAVPGEIIPACISHHNSSAT